MKSEKEIAAVVAVSVVMTLLIVAIVALSPRPAPLQAVVLTPSPVTPIVATPTAEPTPAIMLARLPRGVVAYAAPGGSVLGPIEAGRPYTPTARFGDEWLQVDASGSGLVWLDAPASVISVDRALVDLRPPPTATPAPRPAPLPPPRVYRCGDGTTEATGATMEEACTAWREQFGGNIVQLAPQP